MVENNGLNHWVLEATWAQPGQDGGSVFNILPNLTKKGYFCWFQAAGPGGRDVAARSDGPEAEGRIHPWSISWVISGVTPSHHTSPLLSSEPKVLFEPDWKQMDLSGLLRQVSGGGGWAAKCSQLLGRAPRKLLELGPSSEVRSGGGAKKEKVIFSKTPFSENLKKWGFWNKRK